jgi:uncharacterized protein
MTDFPAEYSTQERRCLLRLAHRSLRAAVRQEPPPALERTGAEHLESQTNQPDTHPSGEHSGAHPPSHLGEPRGAFVTLHEDGQLRGCIGIISAVRPLDETVREMAAAAALDDTRFPPVSEDEFERLQIEISVLSPMFEIAPEDVVVGLHGLMISHGARRGLLLPQVPVEWGWDRESFLAHTCRKAGLPLDQWRRGARIEAFTAEVFGEGEPGESLRG